LSNYRHIYSILFLKLFICVFGATEITEITEITGLGNDGPTKMQGWTLQDWKL